MPTKEVSPITIETLMRMIRELRRQDSLLESVERVGEVDTGPIRRALEAAEAEIIVVIEAVKGSARL